MHRHIHGGLPLQKYNSRAPTSKVLSQDGQPQLRRPNRELSTLSPRGAMKGTSTPDSPLGWQECRGMGFLRPIHLPGGGVHQDISTQK